MNEIISRGYRPLIVNVISTDPYILNYREMIRRSIGDKADHIDECGDFDRFVEELKKNEWGGTPPRLWFSGLLPDDEECHDSDDDHCGDDASDDQREFALLLSVDLLLDVVVG